MHPAKSRIGVGWRRDHEARRSAKKFKRLNDHAVRWIGTAGIAIKSNTLNDFWFQETSAFSDFVDCAPRPKSGLRRF